MVVQRTPTSLLQVSSTATTATAGRPAVRYDVVNVSTTTVHVVDSPHLPYLLLQDDGSLLILHGVNPPDPELDYYGIEIPLTRPLEPGATLTRDAALAPLRLRDHYRVEPTSPDLHGLVTVHCRVGWGERPILPAESHTWSITTLLAWQHLAEAAPIVVAFP